MASSAERQSAFRRRAKVHLEALRNLHKRLEGNNKPLAIELRDIVERALQETGR